MASETAVAAEYNDKPETRLRLAVQRFEAMLTPDERITFQAQQKTSRETPPTTNDVWILLSQVDGIVRSKTGSLQSFSPRLGSVVTAVQQFASIGDVLVGGSQNLIACGVWSAVRLILLYTANSVKALQQLASLFMATGRVAPCHADLATLYPHSRRLQSALYEYHIVVVQICQQLLQQIHKSKFMQYMSALTMTSLEPFQNDLDKWGQAIGNEVLVLTTTTLEGVANTVTGEARNNAKLREVMFSDKKTNARWRQFRAKQKMLQACSTYDYRGTCRQQRKAGTTDFFKHDDVYLNWRNNAASATLSVSGKLGAGKSVLLANIVDDIRVSRSNDIVTFFFCRQDTSNSCQARTIIGSFVSQYLQTFKDQTIWDQITSTLELPRSVGQLEELILQARATDRHVFLVLDAIDECSTHEVQQVFEVLEKLQKKTRLSICYSHRLELQGLFPISAMACQSKLIMPEQNPDIKTFITQELIDRVESEKLFLGDETLIKEIFDVLMQGAQGMFLWVRLLIDRLCLEKTDKQVRQALSEVPKELPELFAQILERSAALYDPSHDQSRVLEIIAGATRPLLEEELREALSVVPGKTEQDPNDLVNNLKAMLACCGSLIVVDEEDRTIRIAHHSMQKYLFTSYKRHDGSLLDETSCHYAIASITVTYLNSKQFDQQIWKPTLPQVSAQAILAHTVPRDTFRRVAALRLLRKLGGSDQDIGPALSKQLAISDQTNWNSTNQFFFRQYAKDNFTYHALAFLTKVDQNLVSLLSKILDKDDHLACITSKYDRPLFFRWASNEGYTALLRELLCKEKPMKFLGYARDLSGRKLARWAAESGHKQLLEFWLRNRHEDWFDELDSDKALYGSLKRKDYIITSYWMPLSSRTYQAVLATALRKRNFDGADWLVKHSGGIGISEAFLKSHLPDWLKEGAHAFTSFLLNHGMSVNQRVKVERTADTADISILDYALAHTPDRSRSLFIQLLLERGAQHCFTKIDPWSQPERAFRSGVLIGAIRTGMDNIVRSDLLSKNPWRVEEEDPKTSRGDINPEEAFTRTERIELLEVAVEETNIDLIRFMLEEAHWFDDRTKTDVDASLMSYGTTKPRRTMRTIRELLQPYNIRVYWS